MVALARKLQSRGNDVVFLGIPDTEPAARIAYHGVGEFVGGGTGIEKGGRGRRGRDRTCNPELRRLVLYPIELLAHPEHI